MQLSTLSQAAYDFERIERAIRFLNENFRQQPTLAQVAQSANMSEYHFQRVFKRWVGISPKRFLQYLTKEHAKTLLAASRDLLDVTYRTGLSSPGRLHDLFVSCEAMTPGEYKKRSEGLHIAYGFHPSPFGLCLLGMTSRGICWLSFVSHLERQEALAELFAEWPRATFRENSESTAAIAVKIFQPGPTDTPPHLDLHIMGTNFQIKVWEALLEIPPGFVMTYEDVARKISRPSAARAVGTAVGRNRISYLIPCHRVLRKMGTLGGYRWGLDKKQALLAWETARFREELAEA